jgi:hypothetical protein
MSAFDQPSPPTATLVIGKRQYTGLNWSGMGLWTLSPIGPFRASSQSLMERPFLPCPVGVI